MVYIDVCGWCKNYYGYIDGKMKCKAYPEGQPIDFCSTTNEICNNNIGLEVKDEMKEQFNKLFNRKV